MCKRYRGSAEENIWLPSVSKVGAEENILMEIPLWPSAAENV